MLAELPAEVKVIVVDFHAEATSDKQLMGRYLDGRVSAVLGTHTHVPTADERILPGGTAFQCDVGMTGPYDSILGRRIDRVLETTLTFNPTHFEVATGDVRLVGTLVDVDPETGRATAIRRICVTQEEADRLAASQQRDEAGGIVESAGATQAPDSSSLSVPDGNALAERFRDRYAPRPFREIRRDSLGRWIRPGFLAAHVFWRLPWEPDCGGVGGGEPIAARSARLGNARATRFTALHVS